MRSGLLAAAILASASGIEFLAAAETSATSDDSEVRAAIAELGAPTFRKREEAERRLINLGVSAKALLQEATAHPDPEIRIRAQDSLDLILEREFQARLSAFNMDVDGTADHDLPCWKRYKEKVGSGFRERELFAEMLRAEGRLLELVETDPDAAGKMLGARSRQMLQTSGRAMLQTSDTLKETICALYFVAGQDDVPISTQTGLEVSKLFQLAPSFRTLLPADTAHAEPLRRILGGWIGRDLGSSNHPSIVVSSLRLGRYHQLPETVAPAQALLRFPGQPAASYRQEAILAIAQFGSLNEVQTVEGLIGDTTSVGARDGGQVQLGDMALATALQIHGQDLTDFGFKKIAPDMLYGFAPHSVGFANAADREVSREKWREFKAKQAPMAPAKPNPASDAGAQP